MQTSLSLAETIYGIYRDTGPDYFNRCFEGVTSETEADACCRLLKADKDEWEHLTSVLMQEETCMETLSEHVTLDVSSPELAALIADFSLNKDQLHLTDTVRVDKLKAIHRHIMQGAMQYAMRTSIPLLFERVVREYRADFPKYDPAPDYLSRAA